MQFSLEISKPRCYENFISRLFTCADVLEQLEDSDGSGDDSAYEDSRIPATSFMPDADGTGTEDMHDMDLDASAMDQDGERPEEGDSSLV